MSSPSLPLKRPSTAQAASRKTDMAPPSRPATSVSTHSTFAYKRLSLPRPSSASSRPGVTADTSFDSSYDTTISRPPSSSSHRQATPMKRASRDTSSRPATSTSNRIQRPTTAMSRATTARPGTSASTRPATRASGRMDEAGDWKVAVLQGKGELNVGR
jgi:hypothetical protein